MAIGALLLLLAAPAFADPGAPALDRASTSVYGNSGEPPKIGGPPAIPEGNLPEQTSGGSPQNNLAGQNQGAGDQGGGNGGNKALPFTGFAAALVLGAGILTRLLGITANAVARRPRSA